MSNAEIGRPASYEAAADERLLPAELSLSVAMLHCPWEYDEVARIEKQTAYGLLEDGTLVQAKLLKPISDVNDCFPTPFWVRTQFIYDADELGFQGGLIEYIDYQWNHHGRPWSQRVRKTYINHQGELLREPTVSNGFSEDDVENIRLYVSAAAKNEMSRNLSERNIDREFNDIVFHAAARDPRAEEIARRLQSFNEGSDKSDQAVTELRKCFVFAQSWLRIDYGLDSSHLKSIIELVSQTIDSKDGRR